MMPQPSGVGEEGFVEAPTLEVAFDLVGHEDANLVACQPGTAKPEGCGPVWALAGSTA